MNGVVLKHQPPPDAAKPDKKWRFYVWKDGKLQDEPLYLHRWVYWVLTLFIIAQEWVMRLCSGVGEASGVIAPKTQAAI